MNWTKKVSRVTYNTGRDQRVLLFSFFRHCGTFFEKNFLKVFPIHQYLEIWSPFAIFEPWIWCRLGPFPAYFFNITMPENFDCCREINVQNEFRIAGFNLRYARICLDFARLEIVKRPDTAPDLIPGTSLTKKCSLYLFVFNSYADARSYLRTKMRVLSSWKKVGHLASRMPFTQRTTWHQWFRDWFDNGRENIPSWHLHKGSFDLQFVARFLVFDELFVSWGGVEDNFRSGRYPAQFCPVWLFSRTEILLFGAALNFVIIIRGYSCSTGYVSGTLWESCCLCLWQDTWQQEGVEASRMRISTPRPFPWLRQTATSSNPPLPPSASPRTTLANPTP